MKYLICLILLTIAARAEDKPKPVLPDEILVGAYHDYKGCKALVKVEPDGVTFTHSMGVCKIQFTDLAPDIRKAFGYDPVVAAAYKAALVKQATLNQPKPPSNRPALVKIDSSANIDSKNAIRQQIQDIQNQIAALQQDINQLNDEDNRSFNDRSNTYYTRNGQVEHRHGVSHNPRIQDDQDQIAALQGQITQLQSKF